MWAGVARTECVFDTGSTRNSIDRSYLKVLLGNEQTSGAVESIVDITPLKCRSVDRRNPITVKQLAYVHVTFKESQEKYFTQRLGLCIVPESAEDIIIGKPTLDEMGFVSDRFHIDLRAHDIRFPTILPDETPAGDESFFAFC